MGIDALVEKDDSLSMDELKAVFGEHADEFIKYCDGQGEGGNVDAKLTFEEFKTGILADTKEMSDDDFKTNWIERMTGCVEAAEAAKPAAEEAAPEEAAAEEAAPAAEEEAAPAAEEEAAPAAEEEAAHAAEEEAAA